MRIFLAINPPDDVRENVWSATTPLREAAPEIAWVPAEKIHLTLKFLGAVEPDAVEPLVGEMTAIARTHAATAVHLRSIGAFPSLKRPRVVWMGVEPEPRLELLHHDVELGCERLGYELEGRPYRPHFTLGRVRRPLPAESLKHLRKAAGQVRFFDDFYARSIDVMQSVPGPGGSRYTMLAAASMKGG